MKCGVLIAGFGGQGVLLMGRLIAEAAMDDGLFVTCFPSYGPEMRGGTANCTTIYSDEEIGSPIAAAYDVVIAMNQPSLEKFESRVRAGGVLLINSSMVPTRATRADVRAVYIPAVELAVRLAEERVANVVMLGALQALTPGPTLPAYQRAISSVIGAKKPALLKLNLEALGLGRTAANLDWEQRPNLDSKKQFAQFVSVETVPGVAS